MAKKSYRIGIDVGINSTGLAAIEVDADDNPTRILNMQSVLHDAGVDPTKQKSSDSRKAVSGVARRTRRMRRRNKQRLKKIDDLLLHFGFPIVDTQSLDYAEEWQVRSRLSDDYVEDDEQRAEDISIAVRHIARHRGWRNPYLSAESLYIRKDYSEQYHQLQENVEQKVGHAVAENLTPSQLVCEAINASAEKTIKLRSAVDNESIEEPLLPSKLMQQDNANELLQIFSVQKVGPDVARALFLAVFSAKSPKGSALSRVGKDPLNPAEIRALRASQAYQRYRIMNVITNLRLRSKNEDSKLTVEQKNQVYELLTGQQEDITWTDVCENLGLQRSRLEGVGTLTQDGSERITSRPPRLTTVRAISELKGSVKKKLLCWWQSANEDDCESMIQLLCNSVDIDAVRDDKFYDSAIEWIDSLTDEELSNLDKIHLESGRGAYSVDTLRKLTHQMLTTDDDLHEARKHVFNIDDSWRSPEERIDAPTGNPAVDRVLKIVNRYLVNCEKRWGAPQAVQIEHVRDAFSSKATAVENKRQIERYYAARQQQNEETEKRLRSDNPNVAITKSSLRRQQAIQRQSGKCLYCGRMITFSTCEMDHIVPRKGVGSTNTQENLVAVCRECNRLKSNIPFAIWARQESAINRGVSLKEAIDRVNEFIFQSRLVKSQKAFKQQVINRLRQTEEDEPIDNRSIESVAWMADELHRRIAWYFNQKQTDGQTKVWVYQGRITADARRASGIGGQIHFVGGMSKTRFDRRHHAVDAAVIALMNHAVAQAIVERASLRESQYYLGIQSSEVPWKEYPTPGSMHYNSFQKWLSQMHTLLELLNDTLDTNRVAVQQQMRLSLGNSEAHDATINKLTRVKVSESMSVDLIRKASTPALYAALTRCDDYDEETGLPENPERTLRLHGEQLGPEDSISFFASNAAEIMTQNGSAAIGNAIHHARVYRCYTVLKNGKKKYFYGMVRVFQVDLLHARTNADLFTYPLPPQSVSMRYAESRVAKAIENNRAEYLGWLVVGDILHIPLDGTKQTGQIGELLDFVKPRSFDNKAIYETWSLDGFFSESRLRLRPIALSKEGLKNLEEQGVEIPPSVAKILDKGWSPSIDTVGSFNPQCIRTNTFGEIRWKSNAHLPVSWKWNKSEEEA